MQDKPTERELLAAVTQFLQTEIVPTLTDHRLKFRALVAANVLQIVGRELELGDAQLRAEHERLQQLFPQPSHPPSPLGRGDGGEGRAGKQEPAELERMTAELARRIRAGEADEGAFHDAVLAHVKQTVLEKLQIANPKYLERIQGES